MKLRIKILSTRFAVAVLTFTVGVAVTLLWVSTQFLGVDPPRVLDVSDTQRDEEKFSLEGWKEIEVKNKLTLQLPHDMQPNELVGDSDSHREAYSNQDINMTIVYREHPSCETARHLLDRSTYQESIIDINGRKAKLGIDRYYQPQPINAHLCLLDSERQRHEVKHVSFLP